MSYEGGDHLWRTHTFNFTLHILWNPQQREPPVLGPRLWINYPWLHDIRQLASPLLPLINYSQWKSNHVCYYCWSSVTYLFPSSFPPSFLLTAMNHFGVTFASLVDIYKGNMIPRGCTLPTLVFFWLCHQKVDISAMEFDVHIQIDVRMNRNNFGETLLLHLVPLIRVCKLSENVQNYWRREPRVGTEGSIGVLSNVEHEWALETHETHQAGSCQAS